MGYYCVHAIKKKGTGKDREEFTYFKCSFDKTTCSINKMFGYVCYQRKDVINE